MKEEINLLAPPVMKERRKRLYYRQLNRLYWVFVVTVGVVLGTYGFIYWTMLQSLESVQQPLAFESEADAEIERRVVEVNRVVGEVHARITNRQPWTVLVEDIGKVLPEGITISSLSVQEDRSMLAITGVSASRVAVITFENALRDLERVSRVDSPLQNLAGSSNISFTFNVFQGDPLEEASSR